MSYGNGFLSRAGFSFADPDSRIRLTFQANRLKYRRVADGAILHYFFCSSVEPLSGRKCAGLRICQSDIGPNVMLSFSRKAHESNLDVGYEKVIVYSLY